MKKSRLLMILLAFSASLFARATEENNPKADSGAIVTSGNARFTVLTPEMLRIEYSDKGKFEDNATFAIVNRKLDVPKFSIKDDSGFLYINTGKLKLKYKKGTDPRVSPENLTVSFNLNGNTVEWHPGMADSRNLKGTCRTLDGSDGDNKRADMEDGLVSRSGWAVVDDSWSHTRPDGSRSLALIPNEETRFDWWAPRADEEALDLYFLGYGHDYKKAISDFTKIAGKIPLPPAYVFGYWYSKYSSYTADDFRQIVKDLRYNYIPADVMILDMDWHWNGNKSSQSEGIGGWTGWSWNTNLIPDGKKLLSDIHDGKFRIALNLHPCDGVNAIESPRYFNSMKSDLNGRYITKDGKGEDVVEWMIDYPDFSKSFFNRVIRDHESEGVDFWWLDWQQHLTSNHNKDLGETFWINHVFFNDMAKNRPDRRPVIFHRWGGLGSHRYQIGFSGDAFINYPTLAFQPYFTATASNVCYGYWGHDLGGHMGGEDKNNPERLLRWMQFGVFTPIFRTHATSDPAIERRIWKFDNFEDLRETVRLRYSLFPYIYTMARKSYDTGISLCRPLYYEYPEEDNAYDYENEYFFGDDILVAPITEASKNGVSEKEIWFPKGKWWSVSTGEMIAGPCLRKMKFTLTQIPYFFRVGSVVPFFNPIGMDNVMDNREELVLLAVLGSDGNGSLYEDKKDNSDYASNYATTDFILKSGKKHCSLTINPRKGTSEGLVAERSYVVRFLDSGKPKSAKVNGKDASFIFNPATHSTIVTVPKTSVLTKNTVSLSF